MGEPGRTIAGATWATPWPGAFDQPGPRQASEETRSCGAAGSGTEPRRMRHATTSCPVNAATAGLPGSLVLPVRRSRLAGTVEFVRDLCESGLDPRDELGRRRVSSQDPQGLEPDALRVVGPALGPVLEGHL